MIDYDDATLVGIMWPTGGGPLWALVWLALVVGLLWVACDNERECEARSCPGGGKARLLDGECVCASTPKKTPVER